MYQIILQNLLSALILALCENIKGLKMTALFQATKFLGRSS